MLHKAFYPKNIDANASMGLNNFTTVDNTEHFMKADDTEYSN